MSTLDRTVHTPNMSNKPISGQIVIDWVDATDEEHPSGEFNLGWSIRADPPLDDERMGVLLSEIAARL